MGNQLSFERSPLLTGAAVLWAGSMTYAAYNLYKNLQSPGYSTEQADKILHRANIEAFSQQANVKDELIEADRRKSQFLRKWQRGEKEFYLLFKQVRQAEREKQMCLKAFCRQYEQSMRKFTFWCLEQEGSGADLPTNEQCRVLQSLQTKRQLKVEQLRKLSLPIEELTEEMNEYQDKLRAIDPKNAEKLIQSRPFPCPGILKLSSDVQPGQKHQQSIHD